MTGGGAVRALPTERKFWVDDREAVLGIALALVFIGSINVFSSSFVIADTYYDAPYFFFKKHMVSLGIGIVGFFIACCVDYHWWIRLRKPIFFGTLVLLVVVAAFGVTVNGARRWLVVGGMQFQPAEFAKLTAIVLEARYISWRVSAGMKCRLWQQELLGIAVLAGLIEQEPDMGTAIIVIGVPILMLWLSNMAMKTKILIALTGIVGLGLLCLLQPYRITRIVTMFDPWADAQGSGYQIVQSLQAIGSGGLFGMGLGTGISKYHYLPEAHTDFAFAVWCQENGYVFALLVLVLFAALTYYGAKIAVAAKDALGQSLAVGFTSLFFLQAVINLFMVSGWGPVVGVPLPFISYGGTALLVNMFAVGALVNIAGKSRPQRAPATSAAPPDVDVFGRPRLRRVK